MEAQATACADNPGSRRLPPHRPRGGVRAIRRRLERVASLSLQRYCDEPIRGLRRREAGVEQVLGILGAEHPGAV